MKTDTWFNIYMQSFKNSSQGLLPLVIPLTMGKVRCPFIIIQQSVYVGGAQFSFGYELEKITTVCWDL